MGKMKLLIQTVLVVVFINLLLLPLIAHAVIVDGIGPDDSNGNNDIDWGCGTCDPIRPPDSSLVTGKFRTIQSALYAIEEGLLPDTVITVLSGTYLVYDTDVPRPVNKAIYIKLPVTLQAMGEVIIIQGIPSSYGITIKSPNVFIQGFTIKGEDNDKFIININGYQTFIGGNTFNNVIFASINSQRLNINGNVFNNSSIIESAGGSPPYECIVRNNTFNSGVLSFGSNCVIQENTFNDITLNNNSILPLFSDSIVENNVFKGVNRTLMRLGSNCLVRGNTFSNDHLIFLGGDSSRIENNTFTDESILITGSDNYIKNNTFSDHFTLQISNSLPSLPLPSNNRISQNLFNVKDNDFLQFSNGISLFNADYNTVDYNVINYNGESFPSQAIRTLNGKENIIENNIVTVNKKNSGACIHLESSQDTTLRGNKLTGCFLNLYVLGFEKEDYRHDIDTSNTADGLPIYYFWNKNGSVSEFVIDNLATKHITVAGSTKVRLQNINAEDMDPIMIAFTDNSTIENINFTGSKFPLQLIGSDYNVIKNSKELNVQLIKSNNNILNKNYISSIYFCYNDVSYPSSGSYPSYPNYPGNYNTVYDNYFFSSNYINESTCSNIGNKWNIEKTIGTNIVGGPYIGGNFWPGYAGADIDGDGLGDTDLPFMANGNIIDGDWLPLVWTGPDLVVTSLSDPPLTIGIGSSFSVTDTTENQGVGAAGKSTTRFYLSLDTVKDEDDILVGSRAVEELTSGENSTATTNVTILSGASFGNYYLIACADDLKEVVEVDETNNCLVSQKTLYISYGPDLVVTSLSDLPATVGIGSSFSVTDTTENQGIGAAGKSATRFYLSLDTDKDEDDILIGNRAVKELAGGEISTDTTNVTIPSGTSSGNYYLIACADDEKEVTEINEGNNCATSQETVYISGLISDKPDLVITSVGFKSASVVRGSSITFTDTIRNRGKGFAEESITNYYLSKDNLKSKKDTLITNRSVQALDAAASSPGTTTVTIPAETLPRSYYIIACADNTAQITESKEKNNCRASKKMLKVKK